MPAYSGHHHRPPRIRKVGGDPGQLTGRPEAPEPIFKPEPPGPVGPKCGGTRSARGRIEGQVRQELTAVHERQASGRACSCGWRSPDRRRVSWKYSFRREVAAEVVRRRNEQGGWRFRRRYRVAACQGHRPPAASAAKKGAGG
jgi:hypothetical protein